LNPAIGDTLWKEPLRPANRIESTWWLVIGTKLPDIIPGFNVPQV
jgi:hypothetical protein